MTGGTSITQKRHSSTARLGHPENGHHPSWVMSRMPELPSKRIPFGTKPLAHAAARPVRSSLEKVAQDGVDGEESHATCWWREGPHQLATVPRSRSGMRATATPHKSREPDSALRPQDTRSRTWPGTDPGLVNGCRFARATEPPRDRGPIPPSQLPGSPQRHRSIPTLRSQCTGALQFEPPANTPIRMTLSPCLRV